MLRRGRQHQRVHQALGVHPAQRVLADPELTGGVGDNRRPASISLIFLPPYSPSLNPVERVWLYLREPFSRSGLSPI